MEQVFYVLSESKNEVISVSEISTLVLKKVRTTFHNFFTAYIFHNKSQIDFDRNKM